MTTTRRPAPTTAGALDVDKLAWLEANAPAVYRDLMSQRALDQARNYRLKWMDFAVQAVANVSGLVALAVLALVSWHAFDVDAPTQGAAIICTGAVSIVAVFVTGRLARRRAAKPDQPDQVRSTPMALEDDAAGS